MLRQSIVIKAAGVSAERAYWLAWSHIKDVGPVTIKRLWEHFGALSVAWEAAASDLLLVDGIGLLSAEKIVRQRPKLNPNDLLAQHEAANVSFWTPADRDYPALLFAINDPPPVLYYRGNLRLNELTLNTRNSATVGIVGTRRPSTYGKRWTQRLSRRLTGQGAVIISGLAAGIDTEAHTSCLNSKGHTVAVVGTGVDVVYPKKNQRLYEQVVDTGLVVSEYPDQTLPDRTHFPQRNRIIAGLSRMVLVTEAPARSGALITARLANDYCREVYALPSSLDNAQGEGCLRLIEQGAQMILGEKMLLEALDALPTLDSVANTTGGAQSPAERGIQSDLSDARRDVQQGRLSVNRRSGQSDSKWPLTTDAAVEKAAVDTPAVKLTPLLDQVLRAVSLEPIVLDGIVARSQLDTGAVLGALVQLELSGLVVQLPGMQYQRA